MIDPKPMMDEIEFLSKVMAGNYKTIAMQAKAIVELKNRIVELEAAHRWIPCSERLPEQEGPFLVFLPEYDKFDYCLYRGRWLTYCAVKVSHWMPTPKLPEVSDG